MPSFKAAGKFLNDAAGAVTDFAEANKPFPNTRLASGPSNRAKSIIFWRLPSGDHVRMYINPQNLQINESKQITPVRTKGGFVVQYWGDNLAQMTLSGTTGSSGIKGINVLRDIYRAENRAFDLVAASQTNELLAATSNPFFDAANPGNVLPSVARTLRERQFILRPSLASLALSVTMHYQGIQYKGFFTAFTVTEAADNVGLFDYTMNFSVTEIRGKRDNFMAWHKEPVADSASGLLLNGVANAIRRFAGVGEEAPEQFHPESAPYTFGGNTTAAVLGFDGNQPSVIP